MAYWDAKEAIESRLKSSAVGDSDFYSSIPQ